MSREMNKTALAAYIAERGKKSVSAASVQLNEVLEAIEHGLAHHGKVALTGFGNFEVKERPARMGRHPKTGEPMDIAASRSVGFKVGKKLKSAVAEK